VETEVKLRKFLAGTEAVLQKSLETLESEQNALESARKALESERKARSEADPEEIALRGWVMGTKEANARLCEQVARQAEGLSALKNFHLGTYLF
jgi:site-specific recombinase XerD